MGKIMIVPWHLKNVFKMLKKKLSYHWLYIYGEMKRSSKTIIYLV